VQHNKKTKSSSNIYVFFKPYIIGTLLGIIIASIFLFLFAFILQSQNISQAFIKPMVIFSCIIASFLGGLVTAFIKKSNGIFSGFIIGLILFLIIQLIGYFQYQESYELLTVIRLIMMLFSGSIGGYIGINNVKKKRK
jgi:putative membrane protein, TIGR04086 family/integral membrane protein, TIGR04097 family